MRKKLDASAEFANTHSLTAIMSAYWRSHFTYGSNLVFEGVLLLIFCFSVCLAPSHETAKPTTTGSRSLLTLNLDYTTQLNLTLDPLGHTHECTFETDGNRFNKYSQIAARALRNSLKEEPRLAAEKRGLSELKYQKWAAGAPTGEQVRFSFLYCGILDVY